MVYLSMDNESKDRFDLRALGAFGIVWVAIATTLGGAALGYLVDTLLGSFPIFMIALLLLGVLGGFYKAYKTIMKDFEKK
jgi:F0F1-type ATP synthase assembly protein I